MKRKRNLWIMCWQLIWNWSVFGYAAESIKYTWIFYLLGRILQYWSCIEDDYIVQMLNVRNFSCLSLGTKMGNMSFQYLLLSSRFFKFFFSLLQLITMATHEKYDILFFFKNFVGHNFSMRLHIIISIWILITWHIWNSYSSKCSLQYMCPLLLL